MEYVEVFIILISFIALCYYFRNKNGLPINWPVVGMLLPLLKNLHRIHDYVVEVLEKSQLNFLFKGPWFTDMVMFVTLEPSNIHHILSKNFLNYTKGPKFNEILDVLGDGLVNVDFDLWKYHRGMAHKFLGHPQFRRFLVEKVEEKLQTALIPVLDHASTHGLVIDLQDLFERFTFDTICTLIVGHDFGSLCVEWPHIPFSKALDDVEEVIFYRHVVPMSVWKFFRWLGVGQEKKYRNAWVTLDDFIYKCIAIKREEFTPYEASDQNEGISVDLLTLYMNENSSASDKFLRDTMINFFLAGRDTTSTALSWFFYLLTDNPRVLFKIREELCHKNINNIHESTDLLYFHGALCESLRLYPPVVFEAKAPIKADRLPSGHPVNPGMQIIFNLYAMARMKSIWGEDCYEFKPERWISKSGGIRHEPSYKFLAFNAGPRTCLGKDMAFTQMKAVAATILKNYNIQVVEGHPVVPDISIILRMKHGLKVKVFKSQ